MEYMRNLTTNLVIYAFIISIFSFTPSIVSAQQQLITDEYIIKLNNRISRLGKALSRTTDANEKVKLINELNRMYDAYEHPDVRLHFIKKSYPKYAEKIIETRQMTKAEILRQTNEAYERRKKLSEGTYRNRGAKSPWPLLSEKQRIQTCQEAAEICIKDLKEESYRYCRFVVDKCKKYLDEETYLEAREKISTPSFE